MIALGIRWDRDCEGGVKMTKYDFTSVAILMIIAHT